MLVSTLDGKLSSRFQRRDSSTLDTPLGQKLPKFLLNMKNYCSIHLRLMHDLNEDRLHDIFMLHPEYHLKFLEENLNFLSRKPTRCNDFKISSPKRNSFSLETSRKVFSLPESGLPSLTFTPLPEDKVSQLKSFEKNSVSCRDTVVLDRSKMKLSNISLPKRSVDKSVLSTPSIVKIKEKYSCNNDRNYENQANVNFKPGTIKSAESIRNKTDSDNQFEFTVAEEKIVSFVCSPPVSRRLRNKQSEHKGVCDSDEESTLSSSKDSSDTASNTSTKSSYSKYKQIIDTPVTRGPIANTNMLLWHPPPTSRNVFSLPESKALLGCSSFNRQIKQKSTENCINFFGSLNSIFAVASAGDRNHKNSLNQETVMFRETALRGCYDIETLLKEVNSAAPEIEKEVSQTREAIFSAVRLQRSNESVVSDSVQSVVDICNSWIKLNAHFERKDFKVFLESNGVDLDIFGDFSQWQCMSRIFVDKLINVLKKLSLDKGPDTSRQFESSSTRRSELSIVSSNLEIKEHTTLGNINRVGPCFNAGPALPPADAQGKRWKQRRFLQDKIDSEKVAMSSNRPCRSNFTVDGGLHNTLTAMNCNTETLFGQGDIGLNVARDFPKGNYVLPTKNSHFAQGDVSQIFNVSKHSGFFDKNITVPNVKCSIRGEPGICTATSANDLCIPVTNLVDVSLNNYFPVNIQETVPTVPPLYNSQLCLVNANQYPPSFNHSVAKPNPIHCIDSDCGENFIQSSYMKPGQYAPPQKPPSFQKTVNNTIPIEEIPAVGIPFLYSAPYTSAQQPKGLEFINSLPPIQLPKDNSQNKESDLTWKTALSMAGSFRDTMIADRIDDEPNCKLPETASMKSHFLLSDGNSQNSSSSGDSFQINCDKDERSPPSEDLNIDFPASKLKTSDWLVGSFNKLSLESDNSSKINTKEDKTPYKKGQTEEIKPGEESNKLECNAPYFSSSYLTNTYNCFGKATNDDNCGKNEDLLNPFFKIEAGYLQKKPRKSKKGQEDYKLFDRKTPFLFSNSDTTVFARPMSNKVTSQLEDILNCIWTTKVTTLINEEIKSEKEIAKLELKVRSPLYLQAVKCKLGSRSYETLDQALADFQQYFVDIRSKNKGDKHCIEAVGALERMFFGMVKKHFGLTCQPLAQYRQAGLAPGSRVRRPKKTPRRL